MKCPACSHDLSAVKVGDITLDVCKSHCGGIWFDAKELQKFDDAEESIPADVLRARKNSDVVIDHSKRRDCPKCGGVTLSRTFYDSEHLIEVDQCPTCAGSWLDLGELHLIRTQRATAKERQQDYDNFVAKQKKGGAIPKSAEAVLKLIF